MASELTERLTGRGGASWRAVLLAVALSASGVFVSAPARADCSLSGSTITCTSTGGTQTAPVGGAGDGLTVTIQSGATVDVSATPNATAVDLNNTNVVTNAGTVISGDTAFGISVNTNNQVTNTGNIIVGNGSTGINACCDNTILNHGIITAGSGGNTFGIFVTDNSTVTNFNTISVGSGGYGIFAAGDGGTPQKTITNSGTIDAVGGFGIGAVDNYNVLNSGTISVGDNGTGIQAGGGNTVTNAGTINVSGGGMGVYLNGLTGVSTSGNTFNNTGSVLATGPTFAIFGTSDNTIVNTGILQGAVILVGTNNILTNRGYMIGADLALNNQSGGQFTGTLINDPSGTIAIRTTPLFSDNYTASTITLNGGRLHMVVKPGLYDPTTAYTPIGGCGCTTLSGTFDSVTTSSPFFTATADYSSGNSVNVTLTRLAMTALPGMTDNQRAVANVLEPGYSTGLTGDLATFYANLFAAASLSALDQLSGAGTAAAQDGAFAAGGQFSGMMMQQVLGWLNGTPGGTTFTFGAPLGYASAPKDKFAGKPGHDAFAAMPARAQAEQGLWRAWTLGFGGARTVDGQGGTANQKSTTFGGAFGIDRQLSPDLLFGFAAGGSSSHFSTSGVATSGRIDAGHVGFYAVQRLGAAYIAATVNYARGDTSTERTIAGVGPTEIAKGRFASDQLSGRFEIGRKYGFSNYSLTPFVALEPAVLWQRGYAESSTTLGGAPGVLGLNYGANTVTSLPLLIGAQVDTRRVLANGQTLSPFARLSWVHEFKPERSVTASFISIPGAAFTADGARPAADALRIEAGGTLTLSRNTALFANFNSEVSARSRSISALGGVRTNW